MSVGVRQRAISAQYKALDSQVVLQVAGMVTDDFSDMVQFGLVHKSLFEAVLYG